MATPFHLDSYFRDVNAFSNPCDYVVSVADIQHWFDGRTTSAIPGNTNTRPLSLTKSMMVSVVSLPYPRPFLYANAVLQVVTIDSSSVITITTSAPPNGTMIMVGMPKYGLLGNSIYYVVNSAGSTFQLSLTSGGVPITTLTQVSPLGFELYVMSQQSIDALERAKSLTFYPNIYLRVQSSAYKDKNLVQTIKGKLPEIQFVLVLERYQFSDTGEPVWLQYKSATQDQVYRFKYKDEVNIQFFSRNGEVITFFDDPGTKSGDPANPYKQTLITFSVLPYIKDGHFANQAVDLVGE
jgi:hypothetical protein